jgi:hypothetical protein
MSKSFNDFVRRNSSPLAKAIKADLPDIQSWQQLRFYLKQMGLSDDELVQGRRLWREYQAGRAAAAA